MSIFPKISMEEDIIQDEIQKKRSNIGREFAWDFKKNDFVLVDGKNKITEGLEALKIWIYKALSTPRYKYFAYSWDYGNEFEELIGRGYSTEVLKSEVERILKEALSINSHIKYISNIETEITNDVLKVNFLVTSDLGEVRINV